MHECERARERADSKRYKYSSAASPAAAAAAAAAASGGL